MTRHLISWTAAIAMFTMAAPLQAQEASSHEEMAWRVFIDAMRPTGNPNNELKLNWEAWIEQDCLFNPEGTRGCPTITGEARPPSRRFMHSRKGTVHTTPPDIQGCNTHTESKRTICEEARLNPAAEKYVRRHRLQDRTQQARYAAGRDLQFPRDAVETKVDWIQYTGACSQYAAKLQGVFTEELSENGSTNCYALAGIHLSSKVLPNWLWATFEPQNSFTNPKRCKVLGCSDSFGSIPARTPPGKSVPTEMTPRLKAMMEAAKLDPVFYNYRMDGVQTQFVDAKGKPTLLGNSIIEADNARVPLKQASCITCHSVSSIATNGEDGINILKSNPIGPEALLPAGFHRRDFAWSLFLALPPGPKTQAKTDLP